MDGISLKILPILILILSSASLAENGPDSCDNSGRYCFAERLYDCVGGEPKLLETCQYSCSRGQCIVERMEPNDSFILTETGVSKARGGNPFFYASLAVVLGVIALFTIRLKLKTGR